MPSDLLPPENYYRLSVPVMQAPQLPSPIRHTYASLRVFAWAGFETPDLSWDQVTQAAGKDRKTIYRHLLTLANTGVTRWRTAGVGLIRLTFTDGVGGAENCLSFETSQKRDTPLSLSLSLPKPKNTGGERRVSKTRRPKNETEKQPTPAAISAFRSVANRFPDKAVWAQITAAVGEKPDDLDRWKRTIEGWIAAGHFKLNVGGMLDWYGQGRTSKGGPASAPKSNGTGHGPMLPEGLLDG